MFASALAFRSSATALFGGPGLGHLSIPGHCDTRLAQAVFQSPNPWTSRLAELFPKSFVLSNLWSYSSGSSAGEKKKRHYSISFARWVITV